MLEYFTYSFNPKIWIFDNFQAKQKLKSFNAYTALTIYVQKKHVFIFISYVRLLYITFIFSLTAAALSDPIFLQVGKFARAC